ncbi:ankyrin [Hesseltinella vesiculosa]|uniref:Ankyrin n=1 Tax=Hesseltinella vesiculosa TaxID=101127 RepID=A0A1X2GWN0_9FUNG|nr:ankyrin [Hesseltinella vesiculosa]
MITDEREETMREVSALGNIKAVQQFLYAGVNVNSQNKMNGWAPLHWASHRGQKVIVQYLMSHGADITIKTNKGQTALDLAEKYPEIVAMLEGHAERTGAGAEPALAITPTYMVEPDLEKSWLLPDEFSENKVSRIIRSNTAKDNLEKGVSPGPASQPKPQLEQKSITSEVVVYLGTKSDDSILGSVYLQNEPMGEIMTRLEEVKKKSTLQACLLDLPKRAI